jgi:hypothetical protein
MNTVAAKRRTTSKQGRNPMPNAIPRYCILAYCLSLSEPTLLLGEFVHKNFPDYVPESTEKLLVQATSGLTLILGVWVIWKLVPPTLKVVTFCTKMVEMFHTFISEAAKTFDGFLSVTLKDGSMTALKKMGSFINSIVKKFDDMDK